MKNNTKKQDILKAYADAIEKYGLEGASLGAVAREIDINQSLIFHYFENKEDLTVQLARHVTELCLQSYDDAFPQDGALTGESFEAFVSYILNVHFHRQDIVGPKLYFALMYLLPRHPQVQQCFASLSSRLTEEISSWLKRFNDAGIISCGDCVMAAKTIISLTDGIFYYTLLPCNDQKEFIDAQKNLFCVYVGYQPVKEREYSLI